jgi:hypothetical protein
MISEEVKEILAKLLEGFDVTKDRPNQKYLEEQLIMLDRMAITFRQNSTDLNQTPRNRAIARDKEQTCLGIINGIKFALAFLERSNLDLTK